MNKVLLSILAGVVLIPGPGAAQEAAISLSDGGIRFPDGTLLETAGGAYGGITVVAKSGARFQSIQAAIDSLADTVERPHLIWIAPGVYEEQIVLKDDVHLQGAGAELTSIVTAEDPAVAEGDPWYGTSSLRALTVVQQGPGTGVLTPTWELGLHEVRVTVEGPGGYGVVAGSPFGGMGVSLHRSEVQVLGGGEPATGIFVYKNGVSVVDSSVLVSGWGDEQVGVEVGVGGVTIASSTVSSVLATGQGGATILRGSRVGDVEVVGLPGDSVSAGIFYSELGSATGEPSLFQCLGAYRYATPEIEVLDSECQPPG